MFSYQVFWMKKERTKQHPKGEIWAEVWYHLQLTINLRQEQLKLLPDPVTSYHLRIGDRQIGKEENELRLVHEEKTPFYFFKWPLPISLTKRYYYDEQSSELEYDIEERLPSLIEERLKRELGQQVKLEYQKVLHEDRDSDKVKLEMFVKVIEVFPLNKSLIKETDVCKRVRKRLTYTRKSIKIH